MSVSDDLKKWDFSRKSIVRDSERFRMKLQIGADAYRQLTQIEKAGEGALALASAGGASATAYLAWYASLGVLGKIGLALGLVATPGGWLLAAGSAAAISVYGVRRIYRRVRKEAVVEVPLFINSPIDLLAAAVCSMICPVLLKIAHADQTVQSQEEAAIRTYFIDGWGISSEYFEKLLTKLKERVPDYTYDKLERSLQSASKTNDVKYSTMANEIFSIANTVMQSDGVAHPLEAEEIARLRRALGV